MENEENKVIFNAEELAEERDTNDYEWYPLSNEITIKGTPEQQQAMFEALAGYYGEVENPENTTENAFFHSSYAPLNEVLNTIRPVLAKHGLAILQSPYSQDRKCSITTIMTHCKGAKIIFPALTSSLANDKIQELGANLTYLRRFAINAIAGVNGEVDDDGNSDAAAVEEKGKKAKAPKETVDKHEAVAAAARGAISRNADNRAKVDDIVKKYGKGKITGIPVKDIDKAVAEINELK